MENNALNKKKTFSLLQIFNYLGAALVFLGIAFFISANWSTLSIFLKTVSTLGVASAAYLIAMLLRKNVKFDALSSALFMVSGLTLPIGIYVLLNILHLDSNTHYIGLIIASVCFGFFLLSQISLPKTIFLFFTLAFGGLFFISLCDAITNHSNVIFSDLHGYEIMSLGLSYILLGRYFDLDNVYPITGPLYFLGGLLVLSSSYFLGGFYFIPGLFYWKIITALFILAAFILAVPLKSKSFLYLGSFFLIFYIGDMSFKFAKTFGNMTWPLILILIGFIFMLLGYLIVYIHRKMAR